MANYKATTTDTMEAGATASKAMNEQARTQDINKLTIDNERSREALLNNLNMHGGGAGSENTAEGKYVKQMDVLNSMMVNATNSKYDINNLDIDANTKKAILDAIDTHFGQLKDAYTANETAASDYAKNAVSAKGAQTAEAAEKVQESMAPSEIAKNKADAVASYASANLNGVQAENLKNIPISEVKALTSSTSDGRQYIDASKATGETQGKVMQLANDNGISVLKQPGDGATLQAIKQSQDSYKYFMDTLGNKLATTPGTNLTNMLGIKLKDLFGVAGVQQFKQQTTDAINFVKGQAGGAGSGNRITNTELDPTIAGFTIEPNDTVQSMMAKAYGFYSLMNIKNNTILEDAPPQGTAGTLNTAQGSIPVTFGSDGFLHDASGNLYNAQGELAFAAGTYGQ